MSLNYSDLERSIVNVLEPVLLGINTVTQAFPEDFEISGRVGRKNHCLVSFRSTSRAINSDTRMRPNKVSQSGTVTYELTLISKRLRCSGNDDDVGTVATEGSIYDMICLIEDTLTGMKFVASGEETRIGGAYCSGVNFVTRQDGCYIYSMNWLIPFVQQYTQYENMI